MPVFHRKCRHRKKGTDAAMAGHSWNLLPGWDCRTHILTAAGQKPAARNRFLLTKQWKLWCGNFCGNKKQVRTAAPWNAAGSRRPLPHRPARNYRCRAVERQDSIKVETKTPKQRDSKRNDTEYSETEYSKIEKNKTYFSAVCQPYQSYQAYQSCTSSQHIQGGQ